jgi:murein L,D-transpeptidase YafK
MPLPALAVGALAAVLLHGPDSARATPVPTRRPRPTAPASALTADSVVVEKAARRLTLFYRGTPVRSYRVALGGSPQGNKLRLGDRRTPEGLYRIDWRNPNSRFHLSLHISYPGPADLARADSAGVAPGGAIMIHGLPRGYEDVGPAHAEVDWTDGCVAVTNEEVEEIWRAVPIGAPIQIKP